MKKLLLAFLSIFLLTACSGTSSEKTASKSDFTADYGQGKLSIVAGSEIKVLEPIIDEFAKKNKVGIEINYLGSLDMMNMLRSGQVEYDAVWPASSIWINLGDSHKLLKHEKSTTISPVVFGIKKSVAESLGFVGKEVSIKDILEAVKSGKMKFAMTSASQSNSGASAYLSFLTALSGKETLTKEDLENPQLSEAIKTMLSGVNRQSGSSNWLVDLFLQADYDAMVNYETLIIQANRELEKNGKEALYVVYPSEGLALSDSPLAYVDKGDEKKEKLFQDFQNYILSDEAQNKIEQTGRRSAFNKVREANKTYFPKEWGLDPDKVVAPMRMPDAGTIETALNLYQTAFKKPALTYYVLDYSGSMSGDAIKSVFDAIGNVMVPEKAKANLLQGTPGDITYAYAFSDHIQEFPPAKGNGEELVNLYNQLVAKQTGGGTNMNEALIRVFEQIQKDKDLLASHTPMIVILSDGKANDFSNEEAMKSHYQAMGLDIPIFSIQFGNADESYIQKLADISRARVFDGRKDLIGAFKSVKGYN